jgi:hypothetical protein
MTSRIALLGAAFLGATTLAAPAAIAQTQMPLRNQAAQRAAQGVAPERAPAALPGATRPTAPGPRVGTAGMRPDDVLFDAVNRGDIASAREALSRGADVDARNVLGLSPVELSIDLGRNDITFLLLSMRGSGSAGRTTPPASRAAASAPVRVAAVAAPAPRTAPVPRPVAASSATPALAPGRDPGTPAPQAGFLGFGTSR